MGRNRCMNCMEVLAAGEHRCPSCGFTMVNYKIPFDVLRPGTVLQNRYLIGCAVGQGGFGITYVGYDTLLNRRVAIKEYFCRENARRDNTRSNQVVWDFSTGGIENLEKGIERFTREAQSMAKLDNIPAVVRVMDSFKENKTAYIVMDFAEGMTLKEYLQNNKYMKWEQCKTCLFPVMESLEIIHNNKFIHRDISPDNIMLGYDGAPVLLDLGAVVDVKTSKGASLLVVKDSFSAPEQYYSSGKIGAWTDVYAMAATLYQCLTGKGIPKAPDRQEGEKLVFPTESSIPEHVKRALENALQLKIENRTKRMSEFQRQLEGKGVLAGGNTFSENSHERQMEASNLTMKWYEFLIKAGLFLMAAGYAGSGVFGLALNLTANGVVKYIVTAFSAVFFLLAFWSVFIRKELQNFEENGPKDFLILQVIGIVSNCIFIWAISEMPDVSPEMKMDITAVLPSAVGCCLNKIYFDRRKSLFTK